MVAIDFFLRKRIFSFILMGLVIVIGYTSVTRLHVETLPEVNAPVIFAALPLPGGAPEEVEMLVTNPVEERLAEIEGISKITSSSWQNVSIIICFFDRSVDPGEKYKEFRSAIQQVKSKLPSEVLDPIIEEISFENLPMMFVGFADEEKTQYELSRDAVKLKKELSALSGVKKVVMKGATDKRIEVLVRPESLKKFGAAPMADVIDKFNEINTNMPGGKLNLMGTEYVVRTIGKFSGVNDLKKMVLGVHDGESVTLGKLADVHENYPEPETIVHLDGKRGVALGIMKKRGFGTIDVAERVKEVLKNYPDVVIMSDSSEFIEHQMGDLRTHALWGACLVMLILFLSLGFKVASIVTFALPMSFFMTFMAMNFKGMTINMVTLFSLLLALGMMVDNSIVVCENIVRHRSLGASPRTAALEGAGEVSWPIFSSTAAIVSAFLPMAFFLGGPIGEFTRPIPIVVTFALVSSLFVANFFNPILCETFLKNVKHTSGGPGSGTIAQRTYRRVMEWSIDHGGIVVSAALLLLVGAVLIMALKIVGLQLFPQLDTAKFYIDLRTPAGTKLEDTQREVRKIEKLFDNSKYVSHYIANIGTSGMRVEIDDTVDFGSNIARFIVDLEPASKVNRGNKETIHHFREEIPKLLKKDTKINFIEKMLGPPVGKPINVQVSGPEFKQLGVVRTAINKFLMNEKGVIDLEDDFPQKVPQIVLEANQANLGRLGMTTHEIGGFIFLALTGYKIGDMVIDDEKHDVFLKIKQEGGGMASIQNSDFTMPDGEKVKFSDLLSYKITSGLSAVEHHNDKRTVKIEAGVAAGYEAEPVITRLKKAVPGILEKLKKGDPSIGNVEVSYEGETMLLGEAFQDLLTAVLVSIALIYLILLLEFRSTFQPLIILVCIPYALVGVILGLLIMGYSFSILAGIGLLCLIGIVVNNGIIFIDYANLLQERGRSRREACLEACATRLRPIILTKATVILGIMPLALASASKTQFWKPLCWAIIWGLLIATTLTLIIIPVVYYITEGWRKHYYEKRPVDEPVIETKA